MSEDRSISSPRQSSVISPDHPSVVYGYKTCQTSDARWLYLEDINHKFYRPNTYDIGGTYIDACADYWFQYATERIADIFLLHLFVSNRDDRAFTISIGTSNIMQFKKKTNVVFLKTDFKQFNVKNTKQTYLTTYSFKTIDVELLKDKQLYIPVLFKKEESKDAVVIEDVKYKHDFGYLLIDPVCSDFTIEVMEGFKFKVHRALLAESSEVFKAMFKDEMVEGQSGYLKLTDVSKEDFKAVLEFIYTGTTDNIENRNVFNILPLADRFNLPGLHELCQYVLAQHLTIDNALVTLVYADIHNADYLKTETLKLIKNNKSIIKSDEFKEIKSAELAREVCEFLVLCD
ncbi:TD and POZ domain-containing protein 3-like [Plodia interpunctella]|uniref:TD and POZ domain-containing protein 3-like n=1 Tax=Plodia interpunctella TaxID=58824 RepID=UPI0023682240|nr:TD and POZ domain-containing protein 3-like [Plodia interpunctella]